MEHLYSIMPLDLEHADEICADIKQQYEQGVATCVLFYCKLVPEGKPLINKAEIFGESFKVVQNRLKGMGLECGILVQCTIGHGYPLNEDSNLTHYVNVTDGKRQYVICPYDVDFQNYIREQFTTLAALQPKVIMVDDDYRLMYRGGRGCACDLHMRAYHKLAKNNLTREQLYGLLETDEETQEKQFFLETQREALLQGARAMREGIDAVDETLPGSFCCVGPTTEFASEIAGILAGKGNPKVVRINNGNYTPAGARWFSDIAFRAADEICRLQKGGVEYILAETDTCPQNRYSTGASSLHAHFVGSILEGVCGAKHWITRLSTHEPNSGKAYRKILSDYSGFYTTLSQLVPTLSWEGCRIPLTAEINWEFKRTGWEWKKNAWLRCVLERLGLPVYCSSKYGGATFMEGDFDKGYTDEEILEMLKGTLFVDAVALGRLNERGFSRYTGVNAREWTGVHTSYEKLNNGCICNVPVDVKELVPLNEQVRIFSTVCHLAGGKYEQALFPGVTLYRNELGGTVVVACGTPDTEFHFTTAFAFLTESRKEQFAEILKETGNLPIYYAGDAEVYMKTARTSNGKRFCAVFNIGLDILDELPFTTDEKVTGVQILQKDGSFADCPFEKTADGVMVKTAAYTLLPIILMLETE